MRTKKTAAKDAYRWAYAEMFFGEGAGIRRKHLSVELHQKFATIPGYKEAFDKAFEKLNLADIAIKAAKERKKLDRGKFISRNVKGLLSGNKSSLTNTVLLGVTAYTIAHQTGLDKVIVEETKDRYRKAKVWYRRQKAEWNGRDI